MPRRSKLTDEERIAAVQEYLEGKGSYATIAKRCDTARTWQRVRIPPKALQAIQRVIPFVQEQVR